MSPKFGSVSKPRMSQMTSQGELNLAGEALPIKEKQLSAVNYESVFEKLEDKSRSSKASRLLFRSNREPP